MSKDIIKEAVHEIKRGSTAWSGRCAARGKEEESLSRFLAALCIVSPQQVVAKTTQVSRREKRGFYMHSRGGIEEEHIGRFLSVLSEVHHSTARGVCVDLTLRQGKQNEFHQGLVLSIENSGSARNSLTQGSGSAFPLHASDDVEPDRN